MAAPAHLLRLPQELMDRIATYLTTLELGNFRLTCKNVETNLFEKFAREFFSKRQFMIERVSLEALVGIANHETLAPYLTEVIIGLDILPTAVSGYDQPSTSSRDVLLATGRARDLLEEAFSKLPNLRSVGLRDYDGNGRYREGGTAKWRSYGWSLGGPHLLSRTSYASPESLFPLLIFALGEASVRPTNLEAFLRRRQMSDRSFDLAYLPPNVAPVLSGLRTLLLSLDDGLSLPGRRGYTEHRHLKDFLQLTHSLEHLRLNFTTRNLSLPINSPVTACSEKLLRWLGTPHRPASMVESATIALEHLTTLDLGMLRVIPETLLRLVSKFAKLKSLSLWKITFPCVENGEAEDDGRSWATFLPKLGKAFQVPDIVSTVMIGFPVEELGNRYPDLLADVMFASNISTDQNGVKKFEGLQKKADYRKHVGSDVQLWLENLGNSVFNDLPDLSDQVNSAKHSFDDEEEEEDDDDDDSEDTEDDEVEIIDLPEDD